MRTRPNDSPERGATAVLIAFSMVGLLSFGGLVIDGGNGYAQRRQMQNASDAAASAGANALYLHKAEGGPAADVYLDARDTAVANGADLDTFTCELVLYNAGGAEVGTASCQGASAAQLDAAWKVRVGVSSEHDTVLASVVGIDTITAGAGAAASLFAGAPSAAAAPFMVCANPAVAPLGHPVPLLLPDADDPTGWAINVGQVPLVPSAVGQVYDIWGDDIGELGRDCGQTGNSFRGLVDNSEQHALPGWWPIDTGNRAGNQVALPLIGGCELEENTQIKDIPVGCQFAFPLCVSGNGDSGTNFELFCVRLGRFEITENDPTGQQDMQAEFLGGGLLNTGAGAGIPTVGDTMVITLSE